jgi:hypothetical protein
LDKSYSVGEFTDKAYESSALKKERSCLPGCGQPEHFGPVRLGREGRRPGWNLPATAFLNEFKNILTLRPVPYFSY